MSSRLLQRQSSDTSVSSTVKVVIDDKKIMAPPRPQRIQRQKVRFHDDDTTIVYYDDKDTTAEERKSLWYSSTDIRAFRDDSKTAVQALSMLQNQLGYYDHFLQAVAAAHQGFVTAQSERDARHVRESCPIHMPVTWIGLERRALVTIFRDRQDRRRRMNQSLREIQAQTTSLLLFDSGDDDTARTRTNLIHLECRAISRPSRLLAQHLAAQSWLSESATMA